MYGKNIGLSHYITNISKAPKKHESNDNKNTKKETILL
jgi:hypothetical protein